MSSASDSAESLPDGVYDSLFTSELAKRLEVLGENPVFQHNEANVSSADLPRALSTHLMHLIRAEIESLDKSDQQIKFTNDLISFLK